MQKSLWSDTTVFPKYNKLDRDIKTDVLIVGGGICGILCAYFLQQAGVRCVLVEKDRIAQATTGNTTAKITSQHGLVYGDLIKNFGRETAQKYLYANETAIKKYDELCKNIDCDFQFTDAYTYSKDDATRIETEVNAVNSLGLQAAFTKNTSLPFKIAGAIQFKNQAQFHPLKFLSAISQGLEIYENTMVYDITDTYADCNGFRIYADKFIVATHFPFINRHGAFFLKLYQYRSYVLALENAQDVKGMYVDAQDAGLSFRNSDNLLLLGGGGQRTGKACGNWKILTKFKEQYYPDSKIKYKWATQDCISLDKMPYIGQYAKTTPNLYVATGFNKWGMTSSLVAATILCDLVQGIRNDYAEIFSPARSILKPQLFINGFETLTNFVIPTTKRCPHLGCALKWNKAEHSWDCSCHGSRFEEDGKLINNPATKDADNV